MFKAGTEFLTPDLKKATFNTPQAVSALQLFADMYQIDKSITPGFLAYTLSEINDLFCSNKVAMSIEGPWMSMIVEEKCSGKKFYTVPVPVPDDMIDQYETAPTLQDMVMIAIVRNVIAPYGQKGIAGELTPQQALDQAAAEAQAIMDGKK